MAPDLSTHTITPEQLATMPNDKDFELVDGRLVKRNMGKKVELGRDRSCPLARQPRSFEAIGVGAYIGGRLSTLTRRASQDYPQAGGIVRPLRSPAP
jgi:hypothetical protein